MTAAPPSLQGLTAAQQAAATCVHAPTLVIAGPGAGKTRTLVARLAYLLESGHAAPHELAAITFTRKAAGELRARLTAALGPRADDITVGTFHQLALLLRPLPAGVRILNDDDRAAIALHVLRGLAPTATDAALRRRARRFGTTLALAKGRCCDYLTALSDEDRAPATAYGRFLDAIGGEDLDDLLIAATRALQQGTATRRFRYVHVDEYQDSSGVQRDLLRALAAPGAGGGATVFAIGDPDQSIYAFRGAIVENFYAFGDDFPGAAVFALRDNFRSTQTLVAAATAVIRQNPPPATPTAFGSAFAAAPQAQRPGGDPVQLGNHPSALSEAIGVARQIERLVGGTSLLSHDQGRASAGTTGLYAFSDIAVLTRTAARADQVATALAHEGVPILRPRRARPPEEQEDSDGNTTLRDALSRCHDLGDAGQVDAVRGALSTDSRDDLAQPHESDEWDARFERVAVLTLHGAKGLEFPVVFLCGCEADLLPGHAAYAADADEDPALVAARIAEERRLFYVGMTRAKDLLYVSHAGSRPRSPFLDDLPGSLVVSPVQRVARRPKPPQLKLF